MPYEHHLEPDINTAFVFLYGEIQRDDFKTYLTELLTDPRYKPGTNIFRDTRFGVLPEEWNYNWFRAQSPRRLGEFWDQMGRCKMAWLAMNGQNFITAHQATLTNHLPGQSSIFRQAFRDVNEARRWLDIPDDYQINFPEIYAEFTGPSPGGAA